MQGAIAREMVALGREKTAVAAETLKYLVSSCMTRTTHRFLHPPKIDYAGGDD